MPEIKSEASVKDVRTAPSVYASPVLPRTFDQLIKFSQVAADSGMVPRDFVNKPNAIVIAVQMGAELGLSPMQALQNISVINGRPSVWGDALLALVKASPACDDVIETVSGEGDNRTATCIVKRRGKADTIRHFSVLNALNANLWDKPGPWKQYPERMLQMRARGFALRDAFPDVLRGLISAEEARDTPIEATVISEPSERPRQETLTQEEKDAKAYEWAEEVASKIETCASLSDLQALTSGEIYAKGRNRLSERYPDLDASLREHIEKAHQRLSSDEPVFDEVPL